MTEKKTASTEELEQRIKDLESELEVSLAREEIKSGGGPIKRALLRTSIGKVAADPTSTIGKALRFPRTCLRIIAYPHLIKEIRQKYSKPNSGASAKVSYSRFSLLSPFDIVRTKSNEPRINILIGKIEESNETDLRTIKSAIDLSGALAAELRIIFLISPSDPITFTKYLSSHKIEHKNLKLNFYSLPNQDKKGKKKYALEVGDSEVFIGLSGAPLNEN